MAPQTQLNWQLREVASLSEVQEVEHTWEYNSEYKLAETPSGVGEGGRVARRRGTTGGVSGHAHPMRHKYSRLESNQ